MARRAVRGGGRGTRRIPRPRARGGPYGGRQLTDAGAHGLLRNVTDTDVRLWRRVHMDLVRYAGCVCRPSC
ncbi:putative leader peptide [Streptomyces sp. NPDC020719]|uniref:putative leader peptide n=1 Tax=unclassified Streptomyces TaxID=2593676 RepID=UPI0033D13266